MTCEYKATFITDMCPNEGFEDLLDEDIKSFNIRAIELVDEELAKKIDHIEFDPSYAHVNWDDYSYEDEEEEIELFEMSCSVYTTEQLSDEELQKLETIRRKICQIFDEATEFEVQ